jgi:hypothetical protein
MSSLRADRPLSTRRDRRAAALQYSGLDRLARWPRGSLATAGRAPIGVEVAGTHLRSAPQQQFAHVAFRFRREQIITVCSEARTYRRSGQPAVASRWSISWPSQLLPRYRTCCSTLLALMNDQGAAGQGLRVGLITVPSPRVGSIALERTLKLHGYASSDGLDLVCAWQRPIR